MILANENARMMYKSISESFSLQNTLAGLDFDVGRDSRCGLAGSSKNLAQPATHDAEIVPNISVTERVHTNTIQLVVSSK